MAGTESDHQILALCAAIDFAIHNDDGLTFLKLWRKGEFEAIKRDWPRVPTAFLAQPSSLSGDAVQHGHATPPRSGRYQLYVPNTESPIEVNVPDPTNWRPMFGDIYVGPLHEVTRR